MRSKRRWRWVLLVYALLLVASHALRITAPPRASTEPFVEVAAIEEDRRLEDQPVHLAYREWRPTDGEDAPVVLLVHGSPGDGANFNRLAPLLAERHRVIAPDLPGFGESTRDVPDYSILAHARYVQELLDQLGIAQVHAVGFSLGGGVVLHLSEIAPERVRSLTLLSSIGVQELELFGQYQLNHAVHGAQLVGLWLLYEAVPHFGLLDRSMLDLSYARNFFDTDQRPLRAALDGWAGPMLILHGRGDVLVPYEAALEHERIVPQSQLVTLDENHFTLFTRPELLVRPLETFFEDVEAGRALTRAQAAPERLAAALGEGVRLGRLSGFALVVSMLLIALSTFVTEDLACIATGLLVARDRISFVEGTLACMAGIFLGDVWLYLSGRWLGRPWLSRAPLKWLVSAEAVGRSARWFERRGALVIFLSRFVPGTRLPTYVAAGMLHMGFWRFTLSLFIPVALWTPLLVGLAWFLGEQVFALFEIFSRWAALGLGAALVLVWTIVAVGGKLVTHEGRRQLVGWWRRKVAWEFWPPWAFYPPVVLYVLWLGLRYRSLTLFTLANPAIPASGFIGESKSAILGALDPAVVARYRVITAGLPLAEKLAAVRAFQTELGSSFPIVLKPDAGQRGQGVIVSRSEEEVEQYFRQAMGDAIVQEHVAGPELGIFYVRMPGEPRGEVFAITDKRLPEVVGDGQRSLARLILDDPRAVAMARTYFARQSDRLGEVPRAGERVQLVEIGTHCRGAVFLDGEVYRTPELERAIDTIGSRFENFFFGRFDLRAPSLDAFRAGENIKVLELNGVTSEATNVYDPKNSLFDAYCILFRQWRLAFEIGALNRERGLRPTSIWGLVRLLRDFRRSE